MMSKKNTMMTNTLKRLMRYKKLDKIKTKNWILMVRKFLIMKIIVLMDKNSKKVLIKITKIILMKREKKMMKNFISIISLNKKSQILVTWTKILRIKLLKLNKLKNILVLIMVFLLSEVQKNNLKDLLMFLKSKLSLLITLHHLLIPCKIYLIKTLI